MPAGVCIEITHNHRKPRFLLRNSGKWLLSRTFFPWKRLSKLMVPILVIQSSESVSLKKWG